MEFQKEYIDLILVPIGLLIVFIYHLFLLYMYVRHPLSTSMGYENRDKQIWASKILQIDAVGRGLDVIISNTNVSISLASISLTLSSLIGVWIANSPSKFFPIEMIYGDTSSTTYSIKYICLLTCFVLAFSCFVQSARHLVHSNYLLSTPGAPSKSDVKKIKAAVKRGSEFWLLGLRAQYCALNFLLWFFGPIPMLVSSILIVVILYLHDFRNSDSENLQDLLI